MGYLEITINLKKAAIFTLITSVSRTQASERVCQGVKIAHINQSDSACLCGNIFDSQRPPTPSPGSYSHMKLICKTYIHWQHFVPV